MTLPRLSRLALLTAEAEIAALQDAVADADRLTDEAPHYPWASSCPCRVCWTDRHVTG